MGKLNRYLKGTSDFLKMFDLHFPHEIINQLSDSFIKNNRLPILTNNESLAGFLYKQDDNSYIMTMIKNGFLSASNVTKSDNVNCNFFYELTNNDNKLKLTGNYKHETSDKFDRDLVRNKYNVFENNHLINTGYFNTYKNQVKINNNNKEFLVLKNHGLTHKKNNMFIVIDYDYKNEMIYYNKKTKKEDENLSGGFKILDIEIQKKMSYIDEQIKNMADEIDPEYNKIIENQKKLLNNFSENLFNNMAMESLKFLSKKQLEKLFNIDDAEYSYKLTRK